MAEETSTTEPMPKLEKSHEGEHRGDYGGDVQLTRATYIFTLGAALNSVNLGYDIGTSTSAAKFVQEDMGLSTGQREIFVGSLNFWAAIGALLANYTTDLYGRRRAFLVAANLFIVGSILQAASPSYSFLLAGRIFVGLGVGSGLALDPLYIAEVTPAKHRGRLVSWTELSLNVGLVLGFLMKLFTSDWRLMFLMGTVIPCIMIVLVLKVLPESPRWLVANNREDEAKEVLQKVYPSGYDVQPVIDDINEALQRENAAEQAVGWSVIFRPTPAFRRMLFAGIGLPIIQQLVGIDAIQYYLVDIIEEVGLSSETKESMVLVFIGLVKMMFIVVGGNMFDFKGRKPMLFTSLSCLSITLFMIAIGYAVDTMTSKAFVLVAITLYMGFFSIGIGPGAWLYASEVFATCIRAKAMSLATAGNRLGAFLMSSTFLSLANAMTWPGYFMLLVVICVLSIGFVYVFVPETKGRSLEEMSKYLAELTGDESILEAEAKIQETLKASKKASDKEVPEVI